MGRSARESFADQYEALHSGCGVVEMTHWSSVTLTGRDRQTFLHNFCTNDVKRLTPGTSCEAFFTNVKGRIIGHGVVTCRSDSLVIVGPPGQGAALSAHLDRYVIRDDVVVRDTTAERSYALLAGGSQARELVDEMGLLEAAVDRPQQPPRWIDWNILGNELCGLIEALGGSAPIRQMLIERGAVPCDMAAFETLRIEAGMPLFGVDFGEQNFPQEVARDEQAISFTKGCYLGQETVARIDALGHVNQRLVGLRFSESTAPALGTPLNDAGKTVGSVTSATFSPRLNAPLALAIVRRPHCEEGSRLDSPAGPCEVMALPV